MAPSLRRQLDRTAAAEVGQRLSGSLDAVARRVLLQGFRQVRADEGTLWLASPGGRDLVPVFNNGPHEAEFLRDFRQPLDRGVTSWVFRSGQPFCENEVASNASHDASIDAALSQVTAAMIVVPLFFADRPRGVVSCVRLEEGSFEVAHLQEMQHCVAVVERLIDWRLFQNVLESEPS